MAAHKEDDEKARAARIVDHMNSQHRAALVRYLEHMGISAFSARNPHAVLIDLSGLSIAAQGLFSESRHTLAFDPPLTSLADARARLVWLDGCARKSLGHAPDTVTRFIPPRTPIQVVTIVGVLLGLVAFAHADNFLPGTWLTTTLLRFTPAFARLCYRLQPLALGLILAIHLTEAAVMAVHRLEPHTIPVGSRLWLLWVLSTFFEGVGAFVRFDEEVRRLEAHRLAKAESHRL